jgi:hypothetical protein
MDVANVSRWDLKPYGDTRYYAVATARNIPVKAEECYQE